MAPGLDRSGVIPTRIDWEEDQLDVTNQTLLGAAAGSTWMLDDATHQIVVSRAGAKARRVVRIARGQSFRSAVATDGQLTVLLGHPASLQPLKKEGVDRLLRFDAAGEKLEDATLGWTAVTVSRPSIASTGEAIVAATLRHGAQLGDRKIVAPSEGMVEAIVRIGEKGAILAITPLEDALPHSTDRLHSSRAVWLQARLRDASLDTALIKVEDDEHVFTRALRWRNDGSASAFPRDPGPLPLGDGVVYAGELSNVDWGDGAYFTSARTMVVRLDANGNVMFTRAIDQSLLSTSVFDDRLFLLLGTAGRSFEVAVLDPDGALLSLSSLARPEQCDMDVPALYGRAGGTVGVMVDCLPYADEGSVRAPTMRHFADLGL